MKLKTALCIAVAMSLAAPAAHAYEGLYGAIGAGVTKLGEDLDFDRQRGLSSNFGADADYRNGVGIYTAIGYKYASPFRTELEFSYRTNAARQIRTNNPGFSGFAPGEINGDLRSYSIFGNVLYDLGHVNKYYQPFIGGGIGYTFHRASLTGASPSQRLSVNDTSGQFGVQAIGGLTFKLAENLNLDVSYRYLFTQDAKFAATLNNVAGEIEHGYRGHNLFAGLRWNFGAPKAAPVALKDCWDGSQVAQTADCPPKPVQQTAVVAEPLNIVVYFDYDKANLTPEAADLIKETAARALANNIDHVKVEGNTDRSGSPAYNQALSLRRADVVRDSLIANGVPAEKIDTSALGENNNAKPTPDGVREPLNRRTEVRISFE